MSERARYRISQKRRLLNLRSEVERISAKAEEKRALQSEIPPKSHEWIKINRDCQQLERRIPSYRREIENAVSILESVKAKPEEKLERPGHKAGGKLAKPAGE